MTEWQFVDIKWADAHISSLNKKHRLLFIVIRSRCNRRKSYHHQPTFCTPVKNNCTYCPKIQIKKQFIFNQFNELL